MKKQVLFFLLVLMPMIASADPVEINGIWYNLITKAKIAEVTKGSSNYNGKVDIPKTVNYQGVTYSVTTIGTSAFDGCSGLTFVTIPNSVTIIGDRAFYMCSSLTSVTIPNRVTIIGLSAFEYCNRLSSVYITDIANWCNIEFKNNASNPLHMAHHLFLNGVEVKDLVIPNNVATIGTFAFQGCTGITFVTINDNVTDIGIGAFSGCTSLISIIIPNSIKSIGDAAFEDCSKLTSLTIPSNVTLIGSRTFRGCSNLTSINIGSGLKEIGKYTFSNCSSLTSVSIPNSVTSIGEYAFAGCSGLTSITIGNGLKTIGQVAFQNCNKLTSVIITDIAAWCNLVFGYDGNPLKKAHHLFLNGTEVKDLVIPNGVTIIERNVFSGCSEITSVTIPNSVTTIKDYAFANCENITNVFCHAEKVPSTIYSIFNDSYIEYATLHVPENTIAFYQSTDPWSQFGSIVALTAEETDIKLKDINCETISDYFLLNGQHVKQQRKGLNIIRNGKNSVKVLVK